MVQSQEAPVASYAEVVDLQSGFSLGRFIRVGVDFDLVACHQCCNFLGGVVGSASLEHNASVTQDADLVRESLDLIEFMADEDDGKLRAHLLQQGNQLIGLLRGEGACGLVQNQELCSQTEGLDQLHALLFAHGQLPDICIGINLEPVLLRYFSYLVPDHLKVDLHALPAVLHAQGDVLKDCHVGYQHVLLVDHPYAAVECVIGGLELYFLPVDKDLSFIGLVQSHDDVHQSRLSGSVLSHKGENLMLSHAQ